VILKGIKLGNIKIYNLFLFTVTGSVAGNKLLFGLRGGGVAALSGSAVFSGAEASPPACTG